MSLAPELAAFIGRPPAIQPRGTPVVGHADQGYRLHDHHHETAIPPEDPMPTGVYERKKKAPPEVGKPEAKPAKPAAKATKKSAKAKAPAAPKKRTTGPRFGVFEDGTVELRLASCTGIIAPTEAREFLGFLKRIGVE